MNAKELREKRQRLLTEMQAITDTAHNDKRELTKDEDTKYNTMFADMRALDTKIEQAEYLEAEASRAAEQAASKEPQKDARTKELEEFRTAVQTVTTTGGGYTIPTYTMADLEKAMLFYGPMLQVSKIINTPTGATMYWPTTNDTGNRGYQIAINTDATTSAAAVTFGQTQLDAYKFTSGIIQVPNELFRDNVVNFQSTLVDMLAERVGRGINLACTTGASSGTTPYGVVTGSTKGSDAAATTITRDDLLDLIYSVDPAYRANAKLMMNDSTVLAIMKLWDTYSGAVYKASPIAGEPATIEGVPFVINNDMAAIGANAKSVLYGDFSKYMIRLVQDFRILQSDQRFFEYDQTGVVCYWSCDGVLLDAGTHPIKHILHASS